MAPVAATVSADAPVTLRAPRGRSVGVALVEGDRRLLRVELRDGAEATYWPARPAVLELAQGYLRLATATPLRVRAAAQELDVEADTDVALELRDSQKGNPAMRPLWLIPTSAASGAALTLGVLVVSGQIAPLGSAAASVPPGQVMVLHPEPASSAPRRVADLEQKVSALKLENGRLAGQLVQKKGVTIEHVRERFATLSREPLGGMLAPGAYTDLLTDLKGLGQAGVDAMIKLLKSTDPRERFLAAKLLEDLNAPAAVDALKQAALAGGDERAVNMASHALALMDDAAAVPALRAVADDSKSSWGAQVNALWGLCKHGDQKAIDQALAWVKDAARDPQARASLGANLMLLPDPELMPIIDQTFKDFGSNAQVASMAVSYYKSVGTAEARDRLETMASDQKLGESVRKAARQALDGKSDKTP
jgi:hypothetical protein